MSSLTQFYFLLKVPLFPLPFPHHTHHTHHTHTDYLKYLPEDSPDRPATASMLCVECVVCVGVCGVCGVWGEVVSVCVCGEWRGEWWLCTSFFTLISSYPHTLTPSPSHSQPQRLWTSFQKLLIAQMTELRNWCVHVCMCDVCVM